MKDPLVTVLMSVYNGEKYLAEAIESILGQTYHDFEFIIIDDGSTDTSTEITASFSDPRIRLVTNEANIGLTRSLNKGIALAKGKYIARMDADDISLPERLEKQVGFMEANEDVAVCGSWGYSIGSNIEIISELKSITNHEILKVALLFGNNPIHSSTILRKDMILNVDGYNNYFNRTQDYDLWQRCFTKGFIVTNIPEFLIKLRIHNTSLSVTERDEQEHYAQIVMQSYFESLLNIKVKQKCIKLLRKLEAGETVKLLESLYLRFFLYRIINSLTRSSLTASGKKYIYERVSYYINLLNFSEAK